VDVVIVGGHGKIALRIERLLSERGDRVRGVIRKPEQAADLERAGAEAVICDIESEDLNDAVKGADAVVFAAGAGPGSGPERKRTVDLGGAVKLAEAAKANGIDRYVIVSSINADRPENWSDQMRPYFEAKAEADERVASSGLAHTIVRPGSLTDEPGTGLVAVGESVPPGEVSRDDVAAVLAETLGADNTIGKAFDLVGGDTPVAEAVGAL
jgi:uncharacterized protein YbjT (DUF2867 family)